MEQRSTQQRSLKETLSSVGVFYAVTAPVFYLASTLVGWLV